jgi:hypothetical protein
MKTLLALMLGLCLGCGSGPSTGIIAIHSAATTPIVDVRIREVTGFTPEGYMQLGPDYADIDTMLVGISQEYELPPATYYVFIKSAAGFWVTDSDTNIRLSGGDYWNVFYTYNGGEIVKR